MANGITKFQITQFGNETTHGTRVLADQVYRGVGQLEDNREIVIPDEHAGYAVGMARNYTPKTGSTITLNGVATFELLPQHLCSGVDDITSGVKDGSGSGYAYDYIVPATRAQVDAAAIISKSFEGGDNNEVLFTDYAYLRSYRLTGAPGEAVLEEAVYGARAAAPVSVTGTDISAASADDSFNQTSGGLAAFPTGSRITVSGFTGAASNNGLWTVATGGNASKIIVSGDLEDDSAGETVTIRQDFTSASLPTVSEMLFGNSYLYIDAAGGTIGTTLVSNTLLGFEFNLDTGWSEKFTGGGRVDFSYLVYTGASATLQITFEHNGSASAERAYWRAGTVRKLRLKILGPALGTSGTNYSTKLFCIDMGGIWDSDSFRTLDDRDGNSIITGTFRAAYDATAALFCRLLVVNELSSLP